MNGLDGFHARPATQDDLSGIVALRNASTQDTRSCDVTADHWQRRHWHESGVDLETDSLLVETTDGRLLGYAELTSEPPHLVFELSGTVHPDFRGRGLGSFLVQWMEQRARQQLVRSPLGSRVVLHQSLFDSSRAGRTLLLRSGFEEVRCFIHLRINMNGWPPQPEWPPSITVSILEPADWKKVGPALGEAFEDHWGTVAQQDDRPQPAPEENGDERIEISDPLAFDSDYFNTPGLCFVAWDGSEVVGSCLCNAKTVEFPNAGYLGSLSIRRPWRRRGIALALVRHTFTEFYRRGTRVVLTDTDAESFTGANHLYLKAGMDVYRQEIVYEKEIRPGQDWLRRYMTS